jgi:A/G-specific adenine glycosylase
VAALLPWFSAHHRDLPWRRTRDPYAVWVSEIMLQQTQVKTVIPYWERWVAELPGIADLAAAPEERVLKLWEGLGYYSRVRNLQKAARHLVGQHGSRFPTHFTDLLALPGVGRSTAGAIASIAFNQPKPILDGNVIRVLTRTFAQLGDPKEKALQTRLWSLAEELVRTAADTQSPALPDNFTGPCSALNQSLMELGATVCLPRNPACTECPLETLCIARRKGVPERFPQTKARPETTPQRFVAAVLERGGKFLVRQRPAGGVNAGFWEFPHLELSPDDDPAQSAAGWLGLPTEAFVRLRPVTHSITRYRIRLEVLRATVKHLPTGCSPAGEWQDRAGLERVALTAAHRRIARQLA